MTVRAHGSGRGVEEIALGVASDRLYAELVDLLERDRELAVVRAAIEGAQAGQGSGIALTGESGAGKSALIAAALATSPKGMRILRGSCDPLQTPRPLGPFRDIAVDAGLGTLFSETDMHLNDVCERVYVAARSEPTILVVEDLHWIDAASVDVLRFLARRVGSMPLTLLVSYRDNEVDPRHAARSLLGDFARLEGLTTLELRPLSLDGVRALVDGTTLEAQRVHDLTGGNPFFATEIALEPDQPLPASVRDAVLARTVEVKPEDFDVLQLVATAPDRLDDRVLPALGVDLPTLRRIEATGLLGRTRGGLVFRHELARQAVESTIPPGGGVRMHARVLDALEQIDGRDFAVLTHHAVAARDRVRTADYARAAAKEAVQAGAHTEAAAFFATALEHLDGAPSVERAELLAQLGYEQYMISKLADAISNVSATFPLWQQLGDVSGLSSAYAAVGVFEYYNGRRRQAENHADVAAATAIEAQHGQAFGRARATRGYLAFMRGDFELANACRDDVRRIADERGDAELTLRSEFLSAITTLANDGGESRALLADHIEAARSQGLDELASTGYSNLANLDVEQRRFRSAEHVLDESIPFTVERDIPICRHWQTSLRSRVHFAQGHWSAALEDAGQVLDGDGMPIATLWPNLITALIALRRGRQDDVDSRLAAAWRMAEQLDEPGRWLAVMSGLAEIMWMTDVPDPRITVNAAQRIHELADAPGCEWAAGDLAVWLQRLGLLGTHPAHVAEPFRLALSGRAEDAAAWWRRAGDPFAEAMALADSPDLAHRIKSIELLDQLGATATADRQRVGLRRDGVEQVPVRPRESTRANPAGLTNRQLEVARLVARGFTNAEIAGRLYISPKTADHHVSAVLTKLGLPNRRLVVVQAEELGLV